MLPSISMVRTMAAPEDSGVVSWKEGFVERRGGSGQAMWCGVNCVLCSNLSFLICEVGFDTSCLQPYLEDKVRRFVFKGLVNVCKQKVFNKYCEFAFNENSKPLYSCREDAWPLFTFPKGLITP